MKNFATHFAVTTLLLCIAPIAACLAADPASPAPESTGPAGSKREARPADPLDRMVQETVKSFQADEKCSGLDSEIFGAQPFVILMTHEANPGQNALEERKQRHGSLAQGVWRNRLESAGVFASRVDGLLH